MSDLMSAPSKGGALIHMDYVEVVNLIPGSKQPRKEFSLSDIEALSSSISESGLINPITVRPIDGSDKYEIITGERRWRAVCLLGWDKIPAIVKNINDRAAQIMALVENLQRENLTPIETALGYSELSKEHGLTHDEVATSVGKPRSSISNYLRLLSLAPEVQIIVKPGMLEMGHAKLLTSMAPDVQISLSAEVLEKKLSVRQLEALIKKILLPKKPAPKQLGADDRCDFFGGLLSAKLGGRFKVSFSNNGKNNLSFADPEILEKFIEFLSRQTLSH